METSVTACSASLDHDQALRPPVSANHILLLTQLPVMPVSSPGAETLSKTLSSSRESHSTAASDTLGLETGMADAPQPPQPPAYADLHRRRMYVGGVWVEATGGRTLPVVSPASEQVVGCIPAGGSTEVHAAVAAARTAFDGGAWSRAPPAHRATVRPPSALLLHLLGVIGQTSRARLARLAGASQGGGGGDGPRGDAGGVGDGG